MRRSSSKKIAGWFAALVAFSAPASNALAATSDKEAVTVTSLSGNLDPILAFSLSASTDAIGKTFSFAFSMPIELSGPIDANSSVSYSLTSLSPAGAQITPLFGNLVVAQEVDTSIGGLAPLNMGVDVGNTFSFLGGPLTSSSPVYTARDSFIGSLQYDLMSIIVSFALSPYSQVGVSGFVQQVSAVPEPGSVALMLIGMFAIAAARRKRQA